MGWVSKKEFVLFTCATRRKSRVRTRNGGHPRPQALKKAFRPIVCLINRPPAPHHSQRFQPHCKAHRFHPAHPHLSRSQPRLAPRHRSLYPRSRTSPPHPSSPTSVAAPPPSSPSFLLYLLCNPFLHFPADSLPDHQSWGGKPEGVDLTELIDLGLPWPSQCRVPGLGVSCLPACHKVSFLWPGQYRPWPCHAQNKPKEESA